jgi:hypothetical protein
MNMFTLMFFVGSLLLISGLCYRKQLAYNAFYSYVLFENTMIQLHNKYLRSKINVFSHNNMSIVELYSDDFALNKYILNRKTDLDDDKINSINVNFKNLNLFMSVELEVESNVIDVTKEVNLFISNNSKFIFDYDFANILNKFLKLNLDINPSNYCWNMMDKKLQTYNGSLLEFEIDNDSKLIFNNK